MKRLMIVLLAVLTILGVAIVANRISADAMAVVVGVVAGIGAAIPAMIVMLWLLGRQRQEEPPAAPAPPMPTIMIVSPPTPYGVLPYGQEVYYPPMTVGERHRRELPAEVIDAD